MKKLIAILSIAMIGLSSSANAQKIGHINTDSAFSEVPGYAQAEAEMQEYARRKEREVQEAITSYQALAADFQKNQATMSDDRRAMEYENLQAREQTVMKFREVSAQRVQEKQKTLMAPLEKQLKDAIAKVAKEKGYAYIFEKSLILNIAGGNDVTGLVIAELKRNAVPVTNRPAPGTTPTVAPIMTRP